MSRNASNTTSVAVCGGLPIFAAKSGALHLCSTGTSGADASSFAALLGIWLSLLSVIAGLIIALRSQHRRRLEKFARVREAAGRWAFSPRKTTQTTTQEPVKETQIAATQPVEVAQPAQIARRPISRTEFLRLAGAQTYAEVAEIAQAHDLNGNYGDWLASRRSVAELAKMVDLSPRTAQYWVNPPAKKES